MSKEALKLALEALSPDPYRSEWAVEEDKCKAITAIKAALEAKDEPVAIFKADLDGGYVDLLAFQGQPLSDNTLLYTIPPQSTWVGLTDQEIGQVFQEKCTEHGQLLNERAFRIAARWAEEKLKEKNCSL